MLALTPSQNTQYCHIYKVQQCPLNSKEMACDITGLLWPPRLCWLRRNVTHIYSQEMEYKHCVDGWMAILWISSVCVENMERPFEIEMCTQFTSYTYMVAVTATKQHINYKLMTMAFPGFGNCVHALAATSSILFI